MKRMTLTLTAILAVSLPALSQNPTSDPPPWLEPVSFPSSGHSICSPDSWKLVFWDNFNGNNIDNTKWITYKSWKGLQRSTSNGTVQWDHDDWSGSRHEGIDDQGVSEKNVFRDENVVVSNGTAKLKIKHEPYSWKCPSCPESERQNVKYTGAALCTYYYYNGQPRLFNSGRFEFRARFPDFPHSFGTAWTWFGEHMGVNELDLAESNGAKWSGNPNNDWLRWINWKNYVGRIYHPTHAWGKAANNNGNIAPYPIPYHYEKDVRREDDPAHYPGQNWSNFIAGTMFDFTQWNTYTVEWDSTEVKTYLNHVLLDRLPKYYYKQQVGPYFYIKVNPGCNADRPYEVTRGFPYSKNSGSQLRFTAGVKKDVQMDNGNSVYDMGEIELDYVGIWQRQQEPGYQEICQTPLAPSFMSIFGNPQLCGSGNYNVSQLFPGGSWSANNNAVTFSGFSNNNTVATVTENPNSPFQTVIITYTYTPPGCPPKSASFHITTNNRQTPTVFCTVQNFPFKKNFTLKVHNPLPGAVYSWKVWYGIFGTWEHYYQANGATIITPKIFHGFSPTFVVKWELTETRCGIVRKYKGMRDMIQYYPASYNKPLTYMEKDKSAIYLEARFSETDSIAYEREVADLIATKYIDDPADTALITEIINDAYFERLEKYLYFAESETDYDEMESFSANVSMPLTESPFKKSAIYPNPTQADLCRVELSKAFNQMEATPIRYRLLDLNQTVLYAGTLDQEQYINLKSIQNSGIYIVELKQNNQLEYIKLNRLK